MESIPNELAVYIIEFLHNDVSALRSIQRVCNRFHPPASDLLERYVARFAGVETQRKDESWKRAIWAQKIEPILSAQQEALNALRLPASLSGTVVEGHCKTFFFGLGRDQSVTCWDLTANLMVNRLENTCWQHVFAREGLGKHCVWGLVQIPGMTHRKPIGWVVGDGAFLQERDPGGSRTPQGLIKCVDGREVGLDQLSCTFTLRLNAQSKPTSATFSITVDNHQIGHGVSTVVDDSQMFSTIRCFISGRPALVFGGEHFFHIMTFPREIPADEKLPVSDITIDGPSTLCVLPRLGVFLQRRDTGVSLIQFLLDENEQVIQKEIRGSLPDWLMLAEAVTSRGVWVSDEKLGAYLSKNWYDSSLDF